MPLEHVEQLPLENGAWQHAVDEVRPIERPDELGRRPEFELCGNVAAHSCRSGRRIRMDAAARKQLPEPAELPILRSEVMTPLADAVRFVNGDEARIPCGEAGDEA